MNPRRPTADALYGNIHKECVIEVSDYSSIRSNFRKMSNGEFVDLMDDDNASQREPWVKVRWINIGGLSWDVIKAVAIRYDLHPLALEDVFHGHIRNRSKADYYRQHLFLRVLCHELNRDEKKQSEAFGFPGHADRSSSPEPIKEEEDTPDESRGNGHDESAKISLSKSRRSSTMRRRSVPILPSTQADIPPTPLTPAWNSPSRLASLLKREAQIKEVRERQKVAEVSVAALKQDGRVNVNVSPMFIFLFRDGTVISIHPTPDLSLTAPITQRLRQRDTVLRKSADASLLVHGILDLIVDNALQVVDEYQIKINNYERDILLKPNMKTVKQLHILSGDLILHKRTLEPIKTLLYGLRRYDVDRCAALIDSSDPTNADVKVVGFMSHKSKIYLADVFDHMEHILSSLDMFAGIAENLIDYTFNLASYEMNEVMRRLTLATIIFLPLTFLSGYFGMNFVNEWSVQHHSDLLFWEIAIPIMLVITPMFMWSDIQKAYHFVQKKMISKKAVQMYKLS